MYKARVWRILVFTIVLMALATYWFMPRSRNIFIQLGHLNWLTAVTFSPDGKTVASGSYDHTVKFWNVADGRQLRTITPHIGQVFAVAYSPDGTKLAIGGNGGIELWNVARQAELYRLSIKPGEVNSISSVAFSPDGKLLASSGSTDRSS